MGKLTRTKVVINKTSLEQLVDLNVHADKVGCYVVIGSNPAGAPLGEEPTAFYIILENDMFKSDLSLISDTHIAQTKEEVLEKLIGIAKHGEAPDEV